EQFERILGRQRRLVGLDLHFRIDRVQAIARRRELRSSHVAGAVKDLPLEVAVIDDVEVDEAERPDAGRRQIHRDWRSEAARADAQDLGGFEVALPVVADLRHDEVAGIALVFVLGEVGDGFAYGTGDGFAYRGTGTGPWHAARHRRNDADRVAGRH